MPVSKSSTHFSAAWMGAVEDTRQEFEEVKAILAAVSEKPSCSEELKNTQAAPSREIELAKAKQARSKLLNYFHKVLPFSVCLVCQGFGLSVSSCQGVDDADRSIMIVSPQISCSQTARSTAIDWKTKKKFVPGQCKHKLEFL